MGFQNEAKRGSFLFRNLLLEGVTFIFLSMTTIRKVIEAKQAFIPSKSISSKKEKVKTGEKTVTKYKTVVESKQVPVVTHYMAWDKKVQTGTWNRFYIL